MAKQMKQFLAVFLGKEATMKEWDTLDEKVREQREAAGMKAWGDWVAKHAASIVNQGAPLGATKHVDKKGISKVRNDLCVYVVVQAESHEAAAKMFLNHPHFTIFPGDSIEVMECLEVPGKE